jgi:hypothetical protein
LEKPPSFLASEGRRMAFKERWLHSAVSHVVQENASEGQWTVMASDDTLLPSLSMEWTPGGLSNYMHLCSVIGYYFKVSKKPHIVILNRHYPHWRSGQVQYLQLVPPSMDLTRTTVKKRQDLDSSLEPRLSTAQQIQLNKDALIETTKARQCSPTLRESAMREMADFILSMPTTSASPKMAKIKELANACIDSSQVSEVCTEGMPPVLLKAGDILRLLNMTFLVSTGGFTFQEEEKKGVASATVTLMGLGLDLDLDAEGLCDEVIECFIIAFKYVVASTGPLCGKVVGQVEQCTSTPAPATSEAVCLEEDCGREEVRQEARESGSYQDERIIERQQSQEEYHSDEISNAEVRNDFSYVAESEYEVEDESSSETDEDMDGISSEEDFFDLKEMQKKPCKRLSKHTSSSRKAKHARWEGSADGTTSMAVESTIGSLACHGGKLRSLLQGVMENIDGEYKEGTDDCAKIFQLCLKYESVDPQHAPEVAFEICRPFFQNKDKLSLEHRALGLMMVVHHACAAAKRSGNDGSWDWIILTLAFHANVAIEALVANADKAYKTYSNQSKPSPTTFPALLKQGKIPLSKPLVDLVDKVRVLHDEVICQSVRKTQLATYEIGPDLIEPVVRYLKTSATGDSNSPSAIEPSSQLPDIPIPAVLLIYQRLSEIGAPKGSLQRKRFRKSVFDALFQTYFSPLIQYLTAKNLHGVQDDRMARRNRHWAMQRRFLLLRLQIIDNLVKNCGLDTVVFAARCACDLVIAPEICLPVEGEVKSGENNYKGFYGMNQSFEFPPFIAKSSKGVYYADESDTEEVWKTIYSILGALKTKILQIAKEKAAGEAVLSAF